MLSQTRTNHDSVWFIVDILTKLADFLPIKVTLSEDYSKLFLKEIVKLHGAPLSIISERDTEFTSLFLKAFKSEISMKQKLSTAFHPKIDGQEERTIQTLEYMLRECVIDFKGN